MMAYVMSSAGKKVGGWLLDRAFDESAPLYVVLILTWLLLLLSYPGWRSGIRSGADLDWEKLAIEHGAAHWKVDSSGSVSFHWNKD